jgi:hypothetical protein
MLQDIRSYFREMNVSEQLADAMLRIEPDKVRLLDHDELDSYGLTDSDPIDQETQDLADAQSLGVSRQEYLRRKSLTERECPKRLDLIYQKPAETLARWEQCYEAIMKTGRRN